jgi:hypothetical protein
VGSLLLLAGCATHHNAPATTAIPEETPFLIERDLRFSPDHWPEVLFADLYLPGAQSTAQAHRVHSELYEMHLRGHVTSFLTAGDAVDKAIGFLARQNVD